MRILVISDIHANLNALLAVLESAGQTDAVWCLGDLVGYGPDPNECIAVLSAIPNLVCLMGNHDAAALGQIDVSTFNRDASISVQWMQTTLVSSSLAFLQHLPEKLIVEGVTLAHGSPRNPVWEYILENHTASANFKHFTTDFCLVGHSHLPSVFLLNSDGNSVEHRLMEGGQSLKVKHRAILNPGSVGQPRDNDPRASYAILDLLTNTWNLKRATYDVAAVQKRIIDAGLPLRHAQRLVEGW